YFSHVGIGTTTDPDFEQLAQSNPSVLLKPLERWPEMLFGMIQLNANDVAASIDAMDRWIKDGPMRGVYFQGGGPGARSCTDRKCRRLTEHAIQLKTVIMQHTWFKTGGKQSAVESTPAELAQIAMAYPEQQFLCAHAGGEWEQGIRAVAEVSNILVETSGFDPTAGFIEMAVRELGSERIVFGSHLPSRSIGTELGKILGAEISQQDRHRILGGNYRRLLGE
ncbi:MAG: amidohydrolase family protein, partial [Planctomycetaceae bacterium]|nr:amidohydrolase family protein [Planctomycetaceae bacterium]